MKRSIARWAIALFLITSIPTTAQAQPLNTPPPSEAPAKHNLNYMEDRGDDVILVQSRLRDLGYYNYKITGQYGRVTEDALMAFQKQNGLDADGLCGAETMKRLFANDAKRTLYNARKPDPTPTPTPEPTPKPTAKATSKPSATKKPSQSKSSGSSGKSTSKPLATKKPSNTKSSSSSSSSSKSTKYGSLVSWSKVSKMAGRGDSFTIKDFNTGTTMRMIVVGGHNHFDVEPATASDTAKLKKCFGGKWSWARRAVLCNLGGQWIAGSINGQPHGYETVSGNDMKGQVCIHFLNSRTHGSNAIDPDHKYQIMRAAGK